ncbi:MAG TPA: hypothetical protein VLS89_19755 [Candidatus Nanopelagicales bacterium]|nr:hypothetical protein [Candidatus Nanopelagicales bacterium]
MRVPIRHFVPVVLVSLGLVAGCTEPAAEVRSPYGVAYEPVFVQGRTVPAGTRLIVRLEQPIGTEISVQGQRYTASVVTPILDGEGEPIVPAGSTVTGRVASLRSGGGGAPAQVLLTVDSVIVNGVEHPLEAQILAADVGAARRDVRAEPVLGGLLGGALLGGVVGGGRGAVIGGAAGAGLGTAISLGSAENEARMPVGTALAIELTRPIPVYVLQEGVR